MGYVKSFSTDQDTDDDFIDRVKKDIGDYRAYSRTIKRLTALYTKKGEKWLKSQENN